MSLAPPRIALLVPCFDAAPFLPALIAGARAQQIPFDELLCYDDGSTDATAGVAAALGVAIVRGEVNRGAAYARNRLLDATTCEWVHFHDADDLIDADFTLCMREHLSVRPPPDAVLCGMRVEDRATRAAVGRVSYEALADAPDAVAYFVRHPGFAIIGVYSRDMVRRIGGFREDLRGNEDPDLHVRLAMAGASFAVERRALVTNLVHHDSFSSRHWTQCVQDRLRCLEAYRATHGESHRALLGRECLSVAWQLYDCGDRAGSRRAVALARSLGARTVDSHRFTTRVLSRVLGPATVFWTRHRLGAGRRPAIAARSGDG